MNVVKEENYNSPLFSYFYTIYLSYFKQIDFIMINEVILKRLDELIGDFDTPFFNYLMYSYDLGLQECEEIIEKLKNDK